MRKVIVKGSLVLAAAVTAYFSAAAIGQVSNIGLMAETQPGEKKPSIALLAETQPGEKKPSIALLAETQPGEKKPSIALDSALA
jgi:hypothetical protein